jgi:hypothetical protein
LGIDLIILKNIGSDIIVQESISVNDIAKVFELVDLALMQQEDLVDIDNIDEFRGDPQIAIFELFFHGNEFVNLQFTTVQYEKYLSCNKSFQVTKYGKLFVSSEDGILINTFEDRIISLSNLQNAFNVIYESRRSPIAGKVNTGTITFAYGGIIHISDIPVKVIQRGNTYFIKDGNLQPIDANILNNSKYNKCYVINIVTDGEIIYILFEL